MGSMKKYNRIEMKKLSNKEFYTPWTAFSFGNRFSQIEGVELIKCDATQQHYVEINANVQIYKEFNWNL